MSYSKTILWCVVGTLAALFFLQAVALADASGAPVATVGGMPMQLPSGWAGLVLVALVFASWALRKYTDVPFFHTTGGAAVMGVLSSAVPALINGIQSGGLTVAVAETALFGAAFSFFASDNASNRGDDQKQRVLAMRVKRAPTPPPPVRPGSMSMLLPLAFVALFASGCPSAGGQALGRCELNTLPSAAGTIIADLVAIAFSGGNYTQQLEDAGAQAAIGNAAPQFNCAVQAVGAWLGSSTPHGQVSPQRVAAMSAFKSYAEKHPAPCCAATPDGGTSVPPRG